MKRNERDCMKKCIVMIALAVLLIYLSEYVKIAREPMVKLSIKTDSSTEKNQSKAMPLPEDWRVAYQKQLDELYGQKRSGRYYTVKDLDANGIPELIIHKGTELTVYSYDQGIKRFGSYDFVTGTTVLLVSEQSDYPGIFYYWVGGGLEHYGYVSLMGQQIHTEELWNEDFTGITKEWRTDRGTILEISKDPDLIRESKRVYQSKKELSCKKILPDNEIDLSEW